jgi:GNAT superfamily N-acetyltransferase
MNEPYVDIQAEGYLYAEVDPDIGLATIEDIYVYPNERRAGVGKGLLERLAGFCLQKGVGLIKAVLLPAPDADPVKVTDFYMENGFTREGNTMQRRL